MKMSRRIDGFPTTFSGEKKLALNSFCYPFNPRKPRLRVFGLQSPLLC